VFKRCCVTIFRQSGLLKRVHRLWTRLFAFWVRISLRSIWPACTLPIDWRRSLNTSAKTTRSHSFSRCSKFYRFSTTCLRSCCRSLERSLACSRSWFWRFSIAWSK
jgi:hypothetical protein